MSWFGESLLEHVQKEYEDFRTRTDEQIRTLRQDFQERLDEKDGLIADLRAELVVLRNENDNMRQIMLPMSSQAGAAYARSRTVRQEVQKSTFENKVRVVPDTDWKSAVAQHMKLAEQSAEEKPSGTQS